MVYNKRDGARCRGGAIVQVVGQYGPQIVFVTIPSPRPWNPVPPWFRQHYMDAERFAEYYAAREL